MITITQYKEYKVVRATGTDAQSPFTVTAPSSLSAYSFMNSLIISSLVSVIPYSALFILPEPGVCFLKSFHCKNVQIHAVIKVPMRVITI